METGNTIFSTSAGTPARLILICSSSPSPSPVMLSPVCSTEPSGLLRLLKKTKLASLPTLPDAFSSSALASRSKSVPVVERASHPRPTMTAVRPGASFVSDTLPPLLRLTPTSPPLVSRLLSRGGVPPRAPVSDQRVDPSDGFPPLAGLGTEESQGVEGLHVLVQVTRVRQAVDDGPPHDALLVDDEGAAHRAPLVLVEDAVRARSVAVRPEVGQQGVVEALLVAEDPQ